MFISPQMSQALKVAPAMGRMQDFNRVVGETLNNWGEPGAEAAIGNYADYISSGGQPGQYGAGAQAGGPQAGGPGGTVTGTPDFGSQDYYNLIAQKYNQATQPQTNYLQAALQNKLSGAGLYGGGTLERGMGRLAQQQQSGLQQTLNNAMLNAAQQQYMTPYQQAQIDLQQQQIDNALLSQGGNILGQYLGGEEGSKTVLGQLAQGKGIDLNQAAGDIMKTGANIAAGPVGWINQGADWLGDFTGWW